MKVLTGLLLIIFLYGCEVESRPVNTGLEGEPMPSFKLLLQDSTGIVNVANNMKDNPAVLFYFRPDCPFCKLQIKDILSHAASLANIRFYLVSLSPMEEIAGFSRKYKLEAFGNIVIGRDYDYTFTKYFRPAGVPFMAIYGADKSLREAYLGNISPKAIKNAAI